MKRQFAVIGLGRFGSSVARALSAMGHEVLAVAQTRRTSSAWRIR